MILRIIVQELCESRGGRPGLSVLTSLLVSVDVKNYVGIGHNLSLICHLTSEDIKHQLIIRSYALLTSSIPTRTQLTQKWAHTPSIAFRHVSPNSARFSYSAERACTLYLRAAVQRRGQRPPKGLGTNMTVEAT